ncbi:MAG: hypothetical protein QM770_05255 [Tepidisphaeraceae bacterium]
MQTPIFLDDWENLSLDDADLRDLENLLMQNLTAGRVIRGTGGARKIRFAPAGRGKGKSGAVRVIYGYFPEFAHVCLFLAYGKDEQADLSANERALCEQLMQAINRGLRKRAGR